MDFYHTLNRGVDKRKIFIDEKDYIRFLHDLFEFNDQKNATMINYYSKYSDVGRPNIKRGPRELLVYVHAFCLMPNHYHLLLSPAVENGIALFMKKLNGGYAKYFNEKYERSGALFQGKYKSVHIEQDKHFMYIPFYIHFNPLDLKMKEWREGKLGKVQDAFAYLGEYRWSSHLDYLGIKNFPSLTQREVLSKYFEEEGGYTKLANQHLKNFELENIVEVALE